MCVCVVEHHHEQQQQRDRVDLHRRKQGFRGLSACSRSSCPGRCCPGARRRKGALPCRRCCHPPVAVAAVCGMGQSQQHKHGRRPSCFLKFPLRQTQDKLYFWLLAGTFGTMDLKDSGRELQVRGTSSNCTAIARSFSSGGTFQLENELEHKQQVPQVFPRTAVPPFYCHTPFASAAIVTPHCKQMVSGGTHTLSPPFW